MGNRSLSVDDIRRMRYAGGGYFREEGPVGKTMPIIHAPEMREILLAEIDRLRGELEDPSDDGGPVNRGFVEWWEEGMSI